VEADGLRRLSNGKLVDRAILDAEWPGLLPRLQWQAARLVDGQDVEDIVQTAYVTAAGLLDPNGDRKADSNECMDKPIGQSPGTRKALHRWLRAILANLCMAQNRETARHNDWLLKPSDLALVVDACSDTTVLTGDDAISLGDIEPHLQARSLKRRRREVWELWRKGHTQREIAAELGLTQQAICYQMDRIIDELRAAAGDLITRYDGYTSTMAMFNAHAKVTIYRRPLRRGAFSGYRRVRRMK